MRPVATTAQTIRPAIEGASAPTKPVRTRSVGHPLPLTTSLAVADYLPLVSSVAYDSGSRTVSWSYEGGASVDGSVDRATLDL